ncbi:MAG: nucleotidyltransferase family protein [Lachnospiraceae bacterium]|nr:nucleotidyltransferase family protein [Lachnospiraceae bacterium]
MKVNAIIAEYNPLHKGHEYLIEKGKEITGADYTIVVMSGNYVQRGEPSVMDKSIRTEAALLAGADLVIELPLYYSIASAEYFAKGAVALIDKLFVVDNLIFGSETDNIELLYDIAKLSLEYEMDCYEIISKYMSEGHSYPKAESLALFDIIEKLEDKASEEYPELSLYSKEDISKILASPNSTLAICYIKSIISLKSDIKPVAIQRITSEHNDLSLGALSSSAIRKELSDRNYEPLKDQLPADVYNLFAGNVEINYPIGPDDYSDILLYKLRSLVYGNGARLKAQGILALTEYLDVSEDLAARIINLLGEYKNFTQFVAILKTKSITYSHISRALMHIILDIKKTNAQKYISNDYSLYARILGFYKESSDLLSEVKENAKLPIISKLADAEDVIEDPLVLKHLFESINASELYGGIVASRFACDFMPELSQKIVIV